MKLPDWMKTKRQRRVGNTVEVTLGWSPDAAARFAELGRAMGTMGVAMSSFGASALKAAQAMEEAHAAFQAQVGDQVGASMVDFVRREVRRAEVIQAGLEARYYVRGAMDPDYATPEDRDRYARWLLEWKTNGPELAAAFLRGWVEHHPEPVCACWRTPESMHYVYYGATEPGSAWEWNPDCPVHLPTQTWETVTHPAFVDELATGWPDLEPVCDGRCITGAEVLEGAPSGSMYATDPECSLHGDGPPELEACHADGVGPCLAKCCPISGGLAWVTVCPPVHPVRSGVR